MKISAPLLVGVFLSSVVGSAARADEAVVQVVNGPRPGSVEIIAKKPVELDSALYVDRLTIDGTFVPQKNLDLGTMKLVTSCDQKVGKTVTVDERGLKPVAWTGMSCASQCNGCCDKNVQLHGKFRFAVKTADGATRIEGPVFTMP